MSTPKRSAAPATDPVPAPLGTGAWVVLPTYNEAENLRGIATAILDALPGATLLVVDDSSPDGTGAIADGLAGADARVRVRHRTAKQGLGRAYLDGFGVALAGGAEIVIQMDADWSHDPAVLPTLIAPIAAGDADLVIGSRYTDGRRRGRLGPRPGGSSRAAAASSREPSCGSGRTTSPAASRPGGRRRSRRSRSTGSTPVATSSRSR